MVRTLGTGTVQVRYVSTVRGYGTWVQYVGTSYRYSVPIVPVFRKCGAISKMYCLTLLGMSTVPPRDAQIENLEFITLNN